MQAEKGKVVWSLDIVRVGRRRFGEEPNLRPEFAAEVKRTDSKWFGNISGNHRWGETFRYVEAGPNSRIVCTSNKTNEVIAEYTPDGKYITPSDTLPDSK